MALVSVYSAKVQDIAGHTGNVVLYLPTGLTVAQITAFSDAYLALLDEVTAGQIISASVALAIEPPAGLKVAPMGGQYIQLGANFGFQVDDSNYRYTLRVPAIREALLTGDNVNLADTAVDAFTDFLSAGDGTVFPGTEEGSQLGTILTGVATFRKG